MSFGNYEWYGWVCFVLAIATSAGVLMQAIGMARGTLKPTGVAIPWEPLIASIFVALALWAALP
jgi:hypothetical protein